MEETGQTWPENPTPRGDERDRYGPAGGGRLSGSRHGSADDEGIPRSIFEAAYFERRRRTLLWAGIGVTGGGAGAFPGHRHRHLLLGVPSSSSPEPCCCLWRWSGSPTTGSYSPWSLPSGSVSWQNIGCAVICSTLHSVDPSPHDSVWLRLDRHSESGPWCSPKKYLLRFAKWPGGRLAGNIGFSACFSGWGVGGGSPCAACRRASDGSLADPNLEGRPRPESDIVAAGLRPRGPALLMGRRKTGAKPVPGGPRGAEIAKTPPKGPTRPPLGETGRDGPIEFLVDPNMQATAVPGRRLHVVSNRLHPEGGGS